LFESASERTVYLPPGSWIDYQSGKTYGGAQWHKIPAGQIPIVLLVKDHALIPHLKVAQSTAEMNWSDVELRAFSTDNSRASGLFSLPDGNLETLDVALNQTAPALKNDPLKGRVKWRITRAGTR